MDEHAPGSTAVADETRTEKSNEGIVGGGPPKVPGASWGEPIVVLDHVWTRFEIWLAMVAFGVEVSSMVLWVCLKGFSTPADNVGALVFRGIVGATVLGTGVHFALAKQEPGRRQVATLIAVLVGFIAAKAWLGVGLDYASNLLNWYQQASTLTLFGGLRGVGTRTTMLLALVGGSLATGRGRHIVIDIGTRLAGPRRRKVMMVFGWVASAVVCVTAAWGFFDHIAIDNFGAGRDDAAGQKIARVASQLGEDFFIVRKQLALDALSTPHILLRGESYSTWLTGTEWNAWLDSAGYVERYGKAATEALKIPIDETRAPLIILPGRGEPRGELINAAYLVFPIGLFIIALRFLVRSLLAISGHVSTEPDESDEWSEHGRPGEEAADALE